MKKLRYGIGLTAILGGCALTLLVVLPSGKTRAQDAPDPVRALVLTELGESAGLVTIMEAQGWNVTTALVPNVGSDDLLSQFDVVWIPAQATAVALHLLVGGKLVVFTLEGGVVVVTGVSGAPLETGTSVDIAPGGPDAKALPAAGAGAVTIVAVDHASITGAGIGGTALTAADLDPTAGGGRGSLSNAPTGAIVIAQNSEGPVAVEYGFGDGHVLVSTLLDPSDACTRNAVLYAESLVP